MVRSSNLGAERLYLSLQVGQGPFEQCAMTGVPAAFELLNDALERKTKVLSFAEPGRGFLCQTRLFGC